MSPLENCQISLGSIIIKGFSAKLNWSFCKGSMIGSFSHMRDAHVCNLLQSGDRSFSSALVKIGLVAIDFEPVDTFDKEPISLLEPFVSFAI